MGDIKAANPTFSASMKMGRTIETMFKNKGLDLLTVPDGVLLTSNSEFSSALFQVMGNMMGPMDPVSPLLGRAFTQLREVSSDISISYKHGASFPDVPTLEQVAAMMKNDLRRSGFKNLPIKGIETLLAGISSIKVDGLPCNWEIKFDFSHFHPSPMLVSMIYDP